MPSHNIDVLLVGKMTNIRYGHALHGQPRKTNHQEQFKEKLTLVNFTFDHYILENSVGQMKPT